MTTKPLGLPDYLKWLDKALRWGLSGSGVYGYHPRYFNVTYLCGSPSVEVPDCDKPKAEYHFMHNYPACVDSVWKSREMLQNSQKCNKK